jgi:hypothetical protein
MFLNIFTLSFFLLDINILKMPTENEITEKAYVKKHKLNQTLNELFLALTQNKPENPIEFAKKHFESKLPTPSPPPPAIDEIKVSNILNISNALSNLSTVVSKSKLTNLQI